MSNTNTNTNTKKDATIEKWLKDRATLAQHVEELTAEHDAAEIKVAEIRGSWSRGDATYSGADLAAAQAEVERTSALLSAQRAKLTAIERRRPISLDLAHVLADRIVEIFGEDGTIERTDSRKGLTIVPDSSMPVELVGGVWSGRLVVARDSAHLSAGIDAEQVDRLLRAAGVDAEVTTTGTAADREAVALTVYGAVEGAYPVLTQEPDRDAALSLVRMTLADAEAALRAPRERGGRDLDLVLPREGNLITLHTANVSHGIKVEEGRKVRTTLVRFRVLMGSRYDEDLIHGKAAEFLRAELGRPLRGLGTVTDVRPGVVELKSFTEEVA